MSNNEEFFCNHCMRETLFFLRSDFVWYCDECGNPKGSYPIDDDIDEQLEEFELEYGEAIYCRTCGNFIIIDDVIEDGICPYCMDEVTTELNRKGYYYDDELELYKKLNEENSWE